MTEERVSDEKLAEAIRNAILSCGHTITADEIVLRRSDKHLGNALHQLHQRILTELQHRRFQDAGGWRDMDSAPRDGTEVILCIRSGRIDPPFVVGEAFYRKAEDVGESDAGWWWANTGPGDYYADVIPEILLYRWQPRPASPTMEPTNAQ